MSDTAPTMEQQIGAIDDLRKSWLPEANATLDAIHNSLTHYAALRAALDVARDALGAGAAAMNLKSQDPGIQVAAPLASKRLSEYAAALHHLIQIQEGA